MSTPGTEATRPLGSQITLSDIAAPTRPVASVSFGGAPISPKQRISLFTPDDWEEFIHEWVYGLAAESSTFYVQIKRFGGSGDKGADVAAFKSDSGLQGAWDCYQCKHYAKSLNFSDAFPEILKVMHSVTVGHYVMPDDYFFLAPRGCTTSFNQLLSKPAQLRKAFLEKLIEDKGKILKKLEESQLTAIESLATHTDFQMFKSAELTDVLEVHRRTPWYSERFATTLAPRPAAELPPSEIAVHESRYVAQLLEVYAEKYPGTSFSTDTVASHTAMGVHFRRQRERFYKAEHLRVYARDAVPPGTYDKLQNDIHGGVIDTAEADHSTGYERLAKVLEVVGQLDLNRHTLISVVDIEDRKGVCHQLANEDSLTWVAST